MHRLVVIGICFVLTLGAFAWGAKVMLNDAALEAAKPLSERRSRFEATLRHAAELRRYVLFMGDSTILSQPSLPASWPRRIGLQLRRRGVGIVVAAESGRDFFHHYCLLPAHLEHEPEVVVLVANLRTFRRGRRAGRAIDLCSHLPPRSWARAAMLAWHDRGVTLPRVALTRLLDVPWIEDGFLFAEGTRRLFVDQVSDAPPPRDRSWRFLRQVALVSREYARPITERHPLVRTMQATVSEATRQGAKVIVVIPPAPHHQVKKFADWEGARFEDRTAMLRRVIEAAGGEVIDLHALLLERHFRDFAGHYNLPGQVRVANAVSARVHRALELPPPKLLRVPDDPPPRRRAP